MTHHPFNCCLDRPQVKTKQTSEVLFCEYGRGVNAILLEREYNPRQDKGIRIATFHSTCDILEEPQEKEISREKKNQCKKRNKHSLQAHTRSYLSGQTPVQKITEGPTLLPSTAYEGPQLAGWAPESW